MIYTRRDFGKIGLAAVSASSMAAARRFGRNYRRKSCKLTLRFSMITRKKPKVGTHPNRPTAMCAAYTWCKSER